eukprot:TRINITY_DN432_c0_g2_i1.p1 TRINITY_DN432_c0_g2~~TRINITY_DN432_c0_g2_i1.p1  ORF type:complete len:747 (-),score=219.58 TRINITY_DN432_c0_g2_i1:1458-3698(-)
MGEYQGGGRMDREVLGYYQRIEKMLNANQFEDEEARDSFLENVWAEVLPKKKQICNNVYCSKVIELLVDASRPLHLRQFLFSFTAEELSDFFYSRYASHVIERILVRAPVIVKEEMKGIIEAPLVKKADGDEAGGDDAAEDDMEVDQAPALTQQILDICKGFKGYWVDISWDGYAHHVLKTFCLVLGGLSASGGAGKQTNMQRKKKKSGGGGGPPPITYERLPTPPEFATALASIFQELVADLNGKQMWKSISGGCTGPVLAAAIHGSIQPHSDDFIASVLQVADDSSTEQCAVDSEPVKQRVQLMMTHKIGSLILEQVFSNASPTLFDQLFLHHFRGSAEFYVNHTVSNFVTQRIIHNLTHAAQVGLVMGEIGDQIGNLLNTGKGQVVLEMAKACRQHKNNEKEFCRLLLKGILSQDSAMKDCSQILITWGSAAPQVEGAFPKFSPVGCMLFAEIANFSAGSNTVFVESFVNRQSPERVVAAARDPNGSRAVDAILVGTATPQIKQKFIKKCKGRLVDLACDKWGSRVIEKIYQTAALKRKEWIATELLASETRLLNSFYGKFAHRACKLDQFKRKKDQWLSEESTVQTVKDKFADIIGDGQGSEEGGDNNAVARKGGAAGSATGPKNDVPDEARELGSSKTKELMHELISSSRHGSKDRKSDKKGRKKKRREEDDLPEIDAGVDREVNDLFKDKEGGKRKKAKHSHEETPTNGTAPKHGSKDDDGENSSDSSDDDESKKKKKKS